MVKLYNVIDIRTGQFHSVAIVKAKKTYIDNKFAELEALING